MGSAAAHAGLIYQGSEVTGVNEVLYNGQSRTFDFVDGTFVDLFSSMIYTVDAINAAAQTSEMLRGTPAATEPSLVRGCEFVGGFNPCFIHFPLIDASVGRVYSMTVLLGFWVSGPTLFEFETVSSSVGDPYHVFAVLRPRLTSFPEPSTLSLFGLCLLSLTFARKFQYNT